MHLAFVDIVYGYAADRPDTAESLGGTTSGICFLARELKKRGVDCTFFNKIERPAEAHGIRALPLEALTEERANPAYSAFIFGGRWIEWLVKHVREKTKAPFIGWMQESLLGLPLVPALAEMDGVVFNSQWQQRINRPYVLPHWRQTVIKNAMNPRFANLFPPGTPIMEAKTKPPILLYAGVTPRGSFHLPAILDRLRPKRTDFTMEIFCNVAPTRDPEANANYIKWMRELLNVTHVGMVGQTELAQRMKRAAILVAPNPWPETSCIALIEALSAGLTAITTNRAVLPETGEGFPRHIAIEDADHPLRFDMPMPYETFAAAIDEAMTDWLARPDETERRLRTQIDHFTGRFQWAQRAAPWIAFIDSFLRS
ncbi:MAG TPA: glycosyltransferase [Alphaproteobacteria bacterium]|nr:glycosyltransferase [Alphaproteobacteria bacterium]